MKAAEANARALNRAQEADRQRRAPAEARDRALQDEQEAGEYVRALLHEREGYVAKGRMDRAAEVDVEIERARKAAK